MKRPCRGPHTAFRPTFEAAKGARRLDDQSASRHDRRNARSQISREGERQEWDSFGCLDDSKRNARHSTRHPGRQFHFALEDPETGSEGASTAPNRRPSRNCGSFRGRAQLRRRNDRASNRNRQNRDNARRANLTSVRSARSCSVPSDALRSQISRKFITLGVLPDVQAVSPDLAGPRVAVLASGVRSAEDAK